MNPNALHSLLAADGSPQAAALLADLRWTAGTPVSVLGVVVPRWPLIGIGLKTREELHDTAARLRRVNQASARALAVQAAAPLLAAGLAAEVTVREGVPAQAILAGADELRASLIALSAHAFGTAPEGRLGPTARGVVDGATCSVLVARTRRSSGPLRLLVAVDRHTDAAAVRDNLRAIAPVGSEAAPEVLVAGLAGWHAPNHATAAELRAHQSVEEEVELRALDLGEQIQALGFRVRNVFPPGAPRAELMRLLRAKETDLVVVGPSAAPPQRGGVAGAALEYAPCSVLVARPLPVGSREGAAFFPVSLSLAGAGW